ncbi:MAG: MarR family winged helix-turn-helix transcriptional regulator [Phormidesmis sp.]
MVSTFQDIPKQTKHQALETAQQMSQDCIARRLRQVNRTVTRLYDEALRPYGLTINQLNVLAVVISQQPIRPGQLGHTLGMEKSTVSRTVDRMVGKNWLKVALGKDPRTQLLTATAKGHRLLLSVTPVWDTLQAGILTTGGNEILNMLAVSEPNADPIKNDVSTAAREASHKDEPVLADDFYL